MLFDLFKPINRKKTIKVVVVVVLVATGSSRSSTRKRYVVKHNLITEVYLMTVMETTTCFGLYWPSSGCQGT